MAADRRCFRCDDPLADAHRICLASTHEGEYAECFRDVDRQVCLDCLAAIGSSSSRRIPTATNRSRRS